MLDFNMLLRDAELDPAEVLLIRHSPVEPELRRLLPSYVVERADLFLAWQQIQWRPAEKAMTRAKYVAAFIGQEPGRGTFAGLSRIGASRPIDAQGYAAFPGNAELITLGMRSDRDECLAFDLEPVDFIPNWIGRLIIRWTKPDQTWWRWASKGAFLVDAIAEESRFAGGMPDWTKLVLSWAELGGLPSSWRATLTEWRGIYFIFDQARKLGYAGSAYGSENIYGRWRTYAETGHGGNKGLRASMPQDLLFSVLERTGPDLDPTNVIALEDSWKRRLHSRSHGMNEN